MSEEFPYQGYCLTTQSVIDSGTDQFWFTPGSLRCNVGSVVPLYADHDDQDGTVVGSCLLEAEDECGLRFLAKFNDTPKAREIETKCREGILNATSAHFKMSGYMHEGVHVGNRVRVLDVAIVDQPSNANHWIALREKRKILSEMLTDLEQQLQRAEQMMARWDLERKNGFFDRLRPNV